MRTKSIAIVLVATCLLALKGFGQNNPADVAGVYQWCPFPCETYRINPDFTFDYLVDGDLFNNERTKGTWKFVGAGKIHLTSEPRESLIVRAVEETKGTSPKIILTVVDQAGAVFPGLTIKVDGRQFSTDDNGTLEVNRPAAIEVLFGRDRQVYQLKDQKTSHLLLEIEPRQIVIDHVFLIKRSRLCQVLEDAEISDCLRKISRKKAEHLFPVSRSQT